MFEQDRDFVRQRVIEVLATWHVQPTGRGTGVGDVEYWCDEIIAHKGWEPYWVDRIGEECARAGHSQSGPPVPPPPPAPSGDPYMVKLNTMDAKLDTLLTNLRRYF